MTKGKPDQINIYVGKRIAARREAKFMSQEELAMRLGISQQQLAKLERGKNNISAARLYRIGVLLDAPIAFFFHPAQGTFNELNLKLSKSTWVLADYAEALAEPDQKMLISLAKRLGQPEEAVSE